jgi:hypothetical protein
VGGAAGGPYEPAVGAGGQDHGPRPGARGGGCSSDTADPSSIPPLTMVLNWMAIVEASPSPNSVFGLKEVDRVL